MSQAVQAVRVKTMVEFAPGVEDRVLAIVILLILCISLNSPVLIGKEAMDWLQEGDEFFPPGNSVFIVYF